MGYTNGAWNSRNDDEKYETGDRGVGFSLTADEHYHLQNKRLTNVSPPLDNNDAATKKNFADCLLKIKTGTTYVNRQWTN